MAKSPENIALDQLDKDQMKTVSGLGVEVSYTTKDRLCQVMQCGFYLILLYSSIFQFSDFLMSYNKLSEMCFTDCVRDFTSRDVKDSEVSQNEANRDQLQ